MTTNENDPQSVLELPTLQDGSRPSCPILLEAKSFLDKAHNLRRALRHLSRSTQRCLTCPENSLCPAIRYFDQAIDLTLQQLTREWHLDQH
jgi:hypothetical protein